MRVWDLPVRDLCRKHLLGQHREIHCIWNVINQNRKGYANHPETKRWVGHRQRLWERHYDTAKEMLSRGYKHLSSLEPYIFDKEDCINPLTNWQTVEKQKEILKSKGCDCKIE